MYLGINDLTISYSINKNNCFFHRDLIETYFLKKEAGIFILIFLFSIRTNSGEIKTKKEVIFYYINPFFSGTILKFIT